MSKPWKDYENAADKGPMPISLMVIGFVIVLSAVLGVVGYTFSWFGEAAQVAKQEFGPSAMLQKYGWFKDAAAQLEKKQADVGVYASRMRAMDETYKDLARQK